MKLEQGPRPSKVSEPWDGLDPPKEVNFSTVAA